MAVLQSKSDMIVPLYTLTLNPDVLTINLPFSCVLCIFLCTYPYDVFMCLLSPCRIFGFVARKTGNSMDNVCHLFAEHDPEQPASAIVNFVSKVMIGSQKSK